MTNPKVYATFRIGGTIIPEDICKIAQCSGADTDTHIQLAYSCKRSNDGYLFQGTARIECVRAVQVYLATHRIIYTLTCSHNLKTEQNTDIYRVMGFNGTSPYTHKYDITDFRDYSEQEIRSRAKRLGFINDLEQMRSDYQIVKDFYVAQSSREIIEVQKSRNSFHQEILCMSLEK